MMHEEVLRGHEKAEDRESVVIQLDVVERVEHLILQCPCCTLHVNYALL